MRNKRKPEKKKNFLNTNTYIYIVYTYIYIHIYLYLYIDVDSSARKFAFSGSPKGQSLEAKEIMDLCIHIYFSFPVSSPIVHPVFLIDVRVPEKNIAMKKRKVKKKKNRRECIASPHPFISFASSLYLFCFSLSQSLSLFIYLLFYSSRRRLSREFASEQNCGRGRVYSRGV